MGWFGFALAATLCWGTADLFYKKGSNENEKYSHLKTTVMVGIVMGIHAVFTLITGDIGYNFKNLLLYLPVSSMYILSMSLGYFGLRYLELSISSPIQNSSGAVTFILCMIFLVMGKGEYREIISAPVIIAVVLICVGIFLLGLIEKKRENVYVAEHDKKYKIGFVAFMMPILYCIFDSLGTFLDAYYLDDYQTTLLCDVTEETFEDVANTSYELTFLIVAIVLLVYMCLIKKEKFVIREQGNRLAAAIFETVGQFFYVYAMSSNGTLAAPMIASYSIVSVILSRIFLKEKLTKLQYAVILAVIAGIVILGVYDI